MRFQYFSEYNRWVSFKNVLVLYGGMSPEHEVSIVSALQVMHALKEGGYNVYPGYVSKEGEWYFGSSEYLKPETYKDLEMVKKIGKRFSLVPDRGVVMMSKGWFGYGMSEEQIEVIFPVFHGRYGEDGAIQGLLEMSGLPYVGCGVTAAAVGMDKYLSKLVAESLRIGTVAGVLVTKGEWEADRKTVVSKMAELGKKVCIKPNDLGSSIGISMASNKNELLNGLEVAFVYANRVLVEKAVDEPKEVNISVLGNEEVEVSATEMPVRGEGLLSFEDKYVRAAGKTSGMASAKRLIPAPVSREIIKKVEDWAVKFFEAIGGRGIARVDFMMDKKGELYFNEINTMPGSLAFYLWKEKGISFKDLMRKLIRLAEEEWTKKQSLVTTFESNILSSFARGGSKGKA